MEKGLKDKILLYEEDIDMKKVEAKRSIIYIVIKRILDLIFAIIGILVMIPVSIIIKLMYISKGDFKSIFYHHTRIGKNGKKFEIYKFRTMVKNSAEMLDEMLNDPKYKKQWDENKKFDDDPRITKVGKILRKTSIDELPQIINILKNDMSLVGPRPLIPGELDSHNRKS